MRRVIAILFMLLLTAQFVQVTMNFSQSSYAITLDEELKEKGKDQGKEIKEVLSSAFAAATLQDLPLSSFWLTLHNRLSKPYLSISTPPPDYAC